MVMCRNDATLGYFINLQMAIRECQKMLCRYGKYVNLDNLL